MKILVIDDMESFRYLLQMMLKEHNVITATDGEEGLKIFFRNNFDLVITDRNMPGMLGEEVIRKVKLSNPQIKTILMSAIGEEGEEEVRLVAKAAGADHFIDKNSLFSEIDSTIKNLFPSLIPR